MITMEYWTKQNTEKDHFHLEPPAASPVVPDLIADDTIEAEADDDGDNLNRGEKDGDLLEDAEVGGPEVEEEEHAGLHGEDEGDWDVGEGQGCPRLLLLGGPQLQLVEERPEEGGVED